MTTDPDLDSFGQPRALWARKTSKLEEAVRAFLAQWDDGIPGMDAVAGTLEPAIEAMRSALGPAPGMVLPRPMTRAEANAVVPRAIPGGEEGTPERAQYLAGQAETRAGRTEVPPDPPH